MAKVKLSWSLDFGDWEEQDRALVESNKILFFQINLLTLGETPSVAKPYIPLYNHFQIYFFSPPELQLQKTYRDRHTDSLWDGKKQKFGNERSG